MSCSSGETLRLRTRRGRIRRQRRGFLSTYATLPTRRHILQKEQGKHLNVRDFTYHERYQATKLLSLVGILCFYSHMEALWIRQLPHHFTISPSQEQLWNTLPRPLLCANCTKRCEVPSLVTYSIDREACHYDTSGNDLFIVTDVQEFVGKCSGADPLIEPRGPRYFWLVRSSHRQRSHTRSTLAYSGKVRYDNAA